MILSARSVETSVDNCPVRLDFIRLPHCGTRAIVDDSGSTDLAATDAFAYESAVYHHRPERDSRLSEVHVSTGTNYEGSVQWAVESGRSLPCDGNGAVYGASRIKAGLWRNLDRSVDSAVAGDFGPGPDDQSLIDDLVQRAGFRNDQIGDLHKLTVSVFVRWHS